MQARQFDIVFAGGIETHLGTCVDKYATDWHFHDGWQIVDILRGSRRFEVRGGVTLVGAGDTLAIPPGVVHRGMGGGESFRMSYLPSAEMDALLAVSLHVASGGRSAMASMTVHVLSPGSRMVPLQQAKAWLGALIMEREHIGAERAYAQARRFRRALGLPPREFGVQLRVNAARRRLLAGHRVAAVASELGFADQSHLGRQFKRAFGLAPGEYARLCRCVLAEDPS